MAKVVAVTEAIKSLAEAESSLNLSRAEDETFFTQWQTELPSLSDSEQTALATLRRRLLYHRSGLTKCHSPSSLLRDERPRSDYGVVS